MGQADYSILNYFKNIKNVIIHAYFLALVCNAWLQLGASLTESCLI